VITIDISWLSQNSTESLSLIDPPGCITDLIPSLFAISTQSGKGKNAFDAITALCKSNPKDLLLISLKLFSYDFFFLLYINT
jgi:hypothetical protein